MDEVTKKTLTLTVEQHEAIRDMKKGGDTFYDVVDRMIELPKRLQGIESDLYSLQILLRETQMEMNNLRKAITILALKLNCEITEKKEVDEDGGVLGKRNWT